MSRPSNDHPRIGSVLPNGMAGSDCSSATRSGANGASLLTYGSGARSGASETNPTCVPGPFRVGADTMSVSGERSTAAPPSAGSALRRDTVPRASLITTARASPVHPTIAGRRSKLSASGRTAPFTGETSSTRNVSAYVAVTVSDAPATYALTFRVELVSRSEEHTSELQSLAYLVCRLLLEKKKNH